MERLCRSGTTPVTKTTGRRSVKICHPCNLLGVEGFAFSGHQPLFIELLLQAQDGQAASTEGSLLASGDAPRVDDDGVSCWSATCSSAATATEGGKYQGDFRSAVSPVPSSLDSSVVLEAWCNTCEIMKRCGPGKDPTKHLLYETLSVVGCSARSNRTPYGCDEILFHRFLNNVWEHSVMATWCRFGGGRDSYQCFKGRCDCPKNTTLTAWDDFLAPKHRPKKPLKKAARPSNGAVRKQRTVVASHGDAATGRKSQPVVGKPAAPVKQKKENLETKRTNCITAREITTAKSTTR